MLTAACVMTAVSIALYLRLRDAPADAGKPPSPAAAGVSARVIGKLVSLENAVVERLPSAQAGAILFTDMQCPFCRVFATRALPAVRNTYVPNGRAFIALKHLPLEEIHPGSVRLAQSIECGRRQSKGWQVHDRINQELNRARILGPDGISSLVAELGLDMGPFKTCMQGESTGIIRQDVALAHELGITGTPTMLYGVRQGSNLRITALGAGVEPFEVVSRRLEEALRDATAGVQ
jgi:protein-disulfide isomerase